MAFTHTITQNYSGSGVSVRGGTRSFTGGGVIAVSESIPASTTNESVAFAIDRSAIQSIALHATGALTIKTNSSSSPAETITLAANEMRCWGNDENLSRLFFSADVTKLYVTNSGTAAVTLTIGGLADITP